MYPFAEQIFAYKSADPERRASALVLGVKGDFCQKVAALLKKLGREADYVEVGLEGRYRYNPLQLLRNGHGVAKLAELDRKHHRFSPWPTKRRTRLDLQPQTVRPRVPSN